VGGSVSRKIRRHVADNVVGYFALFFALGGSAYAAGARDGQGPHARTASETSAYGRYNDGPVATTNSASSLLSVTVPARRYLIIAKVNAPVSEVEYQCRVVAGGDFDRARLFDIGA
jgi:hypothetical protein